MEPGMNPGMKWRLHLAWLSVADASLRARFLWVGMAWILTGVQLALGGAYLLVGQRAIASASSFAVFAHVLPAGVRFHGLLLMILGMSMAACLGALKFTRMDHQRLLRTTLLASAAYNLWTVVLFACAPLVPNGTFSYTSVVVWSALTGVAALLFLLPAPAKDHEDETEMVRIAIHQGVDPATAASLARSYFHGGSDGDY